MSPRLIQILLAVQFCFAAGLVVLGMRGREERRLVFLGLANKAASGTAKASDWTMLAEFLPPNPDAPTVRSVFGPPLRRSAAITVDRGRIETLKGSFWIYYPKPEAGPPLDLPETETLKGPVSCFVVEFDGQGRSRTGILSVIHPLETTTEQPKN